MIDKKWTDNDERNSSKANINALKARMEDLSKTMESIGIDINPCIVIRQYQDLLYKLDNYYQEKEVPFYSNGCIYKLLEEKFYVTLEQFMNDMLTIMSSRFIVIKKMKLKKDKNKLEDRFSNTYCNIFNNFSLDNDEMIERLFLEEINSINESNIHLSKMPLDLLNKLITELTMVGKEEIAKRINDRIYNIAKEKNQKLSEKINGNHMNVSEEDIMKMLESFNKNSADTPKEM